MTPVRISTVLPVLLAAAVLWPAASPAPAQIEERRNPIRMVDPAIDEEGPFAYTSKPNTQLTGIGWNEGFQVTFDGALYTGAGELVVVYGDPPRPMFARQRNFLEGWIPIVQYTWEDGGIRYEWEAFASMLEGEEDAHVGSLAFVRLTASNVTEEPRTASIGTVTRYMADDHRFHHMQPEPFSPDWEYEMQDRRFVRDGKVVYYYTPGLTREGVPGVPYEGPFSGRDKKVTERAEVGLVRFAGELDAGASRMLEFKMPFRPVPLEDEERLAAIRDADYGVYRSRVVRKWREELARGAQLTIPEPKVQATHRASLVYPKQAIWRDRDGDAIQGVNKFQYRGFWLRDAAYILRHYDVFGYHDRARKLLGVYPKYQNEEGLFLSQEGQMDGFGQALYALGQHAAITGDADYAREILPLLPPSVEWLRRARAGDELGVMPPTHTYDNELLIGRYTGHNFWALTGLRQAVRTAALAGDIETAFDFQEEYRDYEETFLGVLHGVTGDDGYIPPGLDVEGGQDWGNLIGVFPGEVLDPFDPRIETTLARMDEKKVAEDLMTYRWGLHHYLTVKKAQNHIFRGEQQAALRHLYGMLVRTGPTNEMFEWEIAPWGERHAGTVNYPPHGWGASMLNLMLRNMLVHEQGGAGGLGPRDIHLLSVISPEWAGPGRELAFENAATEHGPLTMRCRFTEEGASIELENRFRTPPRRIILHVPYFVELEEVSANVEPLESNDRAIVFPPDVASIDLTWSWREDAESFSYEKAVREYREEYARRFEEYIEAGNPPLHVAAPPLLTEEERTGEFDTLYGPQDLGIAVGKPVTASSVEADNPPELVVDGDAADKYNSSWWAGPPPPQWVKIDLEDVHTIDRIRVYPFWDGSRFYQYTVEISEDGEDWTKVGDRSENRSRATPAGDLIRFEPVPARYVRVNMLFNSANESFHLVEVRVFEARE